MDGDRLAVPLTRMEGLKSKLSKGVQGVSQTAKGAVEGVSKGVQLREQTAGAASSLFSSAQQLGAGIKKGTVELAFGSDDVGWPQEEMCEVSPHREVGLEQGLDPLKGVLCLGASQRGGVLWACGSGGIRVCTVELQKSEVLDESGYARQSVKPKSRCVLGLGQRMFTGHEDGALCVVESTDAPALLAPEPLVFREDGAAAVVSLAAVGDREIWTGDKSGAIRVWEMGEEQTAGSDRAAAQLCLTDGSSGHGHAVRAIAAAHGARGVVWSFSADATRVWDAWQRSCRTTVDRCSDVHSCATSGDGVDEFVWTGHGDGSVGKWESRGAELLLVVPAPEMVSRIPGRAKPLIRRRTVRCLVALPTLGHIWVGGTDGRIHVYDAGTGALQKSWQAHHSPVTAMCTCGGTGESDPLMVCTASQRGAHVRVWLANLELQETSRPEAGGAAAEGSSGPTSILKRGRSFNFFCLPEQPLPDSVPLYEHFIVCGNRDPSEALVESIGVTGSPPDAGGPSVVWHVPAVAGQRLNLPKIEDFCFPQRRGLEEGPRQWLGVPDVPLGQEQPFAFSLTSSPDGGTPYTIYCCCHYVLLPVSSEGMAEPWCFCLLSRYPFFSLHFHVLRLLADAQLAGAAGDSPATPAQSAPSESPAAARYGGGFFEEEGSGLLSSPASAQSDNDLISFFANTPPAEVAPPPVAADADEDPFMALATRDSSPIVPPSAERALSPPAVASPPSQQPKTGFAELSAGGVRLLDAYKALGLPARGVTTTVALGGSAQPCSFSRPRQRDEDCSGPPPPPRRSFSLCESIANPNSCAVQGGWGCSRHSARCLCQTSCCSSPACCSSGRSWSHTTPSPCVPHPFVDRSPH